MKDGLRQGKALGSEVGKVMGIEVGKVMGSEVGKVMGSGLLMYAEEGRRENFGLV